MNLRKFLFSHQTAPIAQADEPAQSTITRQEFIHTDLDSKTTLQILETLREQTISFVMDNRLTWGKNDFEFWAIPVQVKLTKSYDIVFKVGSVKTQNMREAARLIESSQLQF